MQISIEVSLYPLNENFISPIDNFISCLKNDSIEVGTNNLVLNYLGNLMI